MSRAGRPEGRPVASAEDATLPGRPDRGLKWQWIDAVRFDGTLSRPAVAVAHELAHHAGKEGTCFPGQDRLARLTRYSPQKVRQGLQELEAHGYLRRRRQWNGPAIYELLVPASDRPFLLVVEERPAVSDGATGSFERSDRPILPPNRTENRTEEPSGAAPPRNGHNSSDGERDEHHSAGSKAVATRPPDAVWNALCEALGSTPAPGTSAHGARNKAAKDLKLHGATPEAIRQAADEYVRRWGRDKLTDTALAKHYPDLLRKAAPRPLRPLRRIAT